MSRIEKSAKQYSNSSVSRADWHRDEIQMDLSCWLRVTLQTRCLCYAEPRKINLRGIDVPNTDVFAAVITDMHYGDGFMKSWNVVLIEELTGPGRNACSGL